MDKLVIFFTIHHHPSMFLYFYVTLAVQGQHHWEGQKKKSPVLHLQCYLKVSHSILIWKDEYIMSIQSPTPLHYNCIMSYTGMQVDKSEGNQSGK